MITALFLYLMIGLAILLSYENARDHIKKPEGIGERIIVVLFWPIAIHFLI